MSIQITWTGHATFRISSNNTTLYIDPWKLQSEPHDAQVILISHSHYDHYSQEDILKAAQKDFLLIGPKDVINPFGTGHILLPGNNLQLENLTVHAVHAYNPAKQFHPKQNQWLGFIIELAGKRIYYAGDTDLIDEMNSLKNIDVALLPVGGTYTMDPSQAAHAAKTINPEMAIPYHWGDLVGSQKDAKQFEKKAPCQVTILQPGQSMTL